MEKTELNHTVMMTMADAEMTEENIDDLCEHLREILLEERDSGADMLSGLVVMGNTENALHDLPVVLIDLAKAGFDMSGLSEEDRKSFEDACTIVQNALSIGLRGVIVADCCKGGDEDDEE